MELFRLFGSVLVDNTKANESLEQTGKKAEDSGGKLGKIIGTAGKVGAAVLSAGTVAAGAMVKMAIDTSTAGDRVDKMSQRLGLSREGFQEWDYVLSQAGVSIDSMQTGMKSLTKTMTDESDKTAERLSKLGLSVDKIQNMSQEDAFEAIVKGFQGMEEGAEKARLAQELFGKQGQEMLPLLNGQAGGIDELKKKAHELGMVMSDEAVDAAVSLADNLDTMKRSIGGLMNQLGSALMPILNDVIKMIIDNMPVIQGLISKLAPILASVFEKLLPPLMDLVQSLLPPILDLIMQIMPVLGELMDAIMPIIIDLLNMLLPPIIEIVRMLLPVLLTVLQPLLPLLRPILGLLQPFIDLLMMIIEPLVELLNMILPPLIKIFTTVADFILPKLTGAFKGVANIVGGVFGKVMDNIKPIFEGVKKVFQGIIDFISGVFTGNWEKAWGGIKKIFGGIWESLVAYVKYPINTIIDLLNAFIRQINKVKVPDWVPLIGGKGINIPEIRRLKVGLDYVPYDDFPALLHKGERVMSAEEAREAGPGSGGTVINFNGPVSIRSDDDITRLAEELERLRTRKAAAYGMA